MCHLYPYKNVKLLWKFFTLIFAVLLVGADFYMRPEYLTVAISDIKFNCPPLKNTDITAGGSLATLD